MHKQNKPISNLNSQRCIFSVFNVSTITIHRGIVFNYFRSYATDQFNSAQTISNHKPPKRYRVLGSGSSTCSAPAIVSPGGAAKSAYETCGDEDQRPRPETRTTPDAGPSHALTEDDAAFPASPPPLAAPARTETRRTPRRQTAAGEERRSQYATSDIGGIGRGRRVGW